MSDTSNSSPQANNGQGGDERQARPPDHAVVHRGESGVRGHCDDSHMTDETAAQDVPDPGCTPEREGESDDVGVGDDAPPEPDINCESRRDDRDEAGQAGDAGAPLLPPDDGIADDHPHRLPRPIPLAGPENGDVRSRVIDLGTSSYDVLPPVLDPHYLLEIEVGNGLYQLDTRELMFEEYAAELAGVCAAAEQVTVILWPAVINLPETARENLLRALASAGERCRVRIAGNPPQYLTPFQATLQHQVDRTDLAQVGRWRQTAFTVAAFFHSDARETAVGMICEVFHERNLGSMLPQAARRELNTLVGRVAGGQQATTTWAAEAFLQHLAAEVGEDEFPEVTDEGEQPVLPLRYFQDELYRRDGNRWRRVPNSQIKAELARFLRLLVARLSNNFIESCLTVLRGITILRPWDLTTPIWVESEDPIVTRERRLVVFRNGMIDLEELFAAGVPPQLQPYNPRLFSQVALPYDYDPNAACPLWEETLRDVLRPAGQNDHRVMLLQEFTGLTLVPGDTQFEKFLIMVGRGRNGKSTITTVWKALLGSENVSHVPLDKIDSDFRLYGMMGKLANIVGDMEYIDKAAEGLLKQLVSGDWVDVNRKHKEPIPMRPTARLIFGCNDIPQFNDRSDGTWRRIIILPFLWQVPAESVDTQRVTRLLGELPGIFNWALQGAIRLYRQGGFTPCGVTDTALDEHRFNSDPFRQFCEVCCELDAGYSELSQTMYEAYRQHCQDNGRRSKNNTEFGKQVLDLPGTARVRESGGNRAYLYRGIRLLADVRRRAVSRAGTRQT
jgi:P4 family phage/plasmid primase-like protien